QFNITSLDGAGNATRQSVDLLIDKTAPTITLTRKNPSPVGQGNADVGFVVDLSEPMLGLSESDISLTNASLLSWTPVANANGLRYELVVRASNDLKDSLGVQIQAGAGTDVAGNANAAVQTSVPPPSPFALTTTTRWALNG
ncbi:MAG: hypothetical protein EBZ60_05830, partial [Betaproteobacteria bacterium]|nr:hypothetical protein [Betaproteobacteria bacterium]